MNLQEAIIAIGTAIGAASAAAGGAFALGRRQTTKAESAAEGVETILAPIQHMIEDTLRPLEQRLAHIESQQAETSRQIRELQAEVRANQTRLERVAVTLEERTRPRRYPSKEKSHE